MHKLFNSVGILLILIIVSVSCKQEQASNTKYVDMDIGGVGHILKPTRPTVQLPNQMVRMYPLRMDYLDDQISWFPMSISSHRKGELFGFKVVNGKKGKDNPEYELTYDHELEVKKPWYYSAWLIDDEIQLEYAPGAKSGMFRAQFQEDECTFLFSTFQKGSSYSIDGNILKGVEEFEGMKAFVYGVISESGTTGTEKGYGTTLKGKKYESNYAWLAADLSENKTASFKYGFSFISIEKAKENLEREIPAWDFDALVAKGKKEWEQRIDQVQVKGGTEAQRRTFYTSLYRTYERMIDINEGGQYYSAYDHKLHESEEPFYVDDWCWDTYLATHPLRTILEPETQRDMLRSYIDMYDQSGWMPQFPLTYGDDPAMNGFHSTIMFLDSWRKGIRDFDHEKAYEGMKKNATSATMLPWKNGPNCSLDSFYYENGYFPAIRHDEVETVKEVHSFERRQAVAITLGHSYDDWALAQMAKDLGKENDYNLFLPKSKNYKNLYNAKEKLMWPKDAEGNWIDMNPKFDGGPGGRSYYDENNGYTFAWQVQQDIPGLIELMGGKSGFEANLDNLFREPLDMWKYQFWAKFPDATGLVGQYSMGNEPSFHIPYMYNFTDSPWKTQKRIRFLMDVWYKDDIFGIPGDEDGGGMTAFVAFSMMGFYPMTPGIPWYTIGSPVFEEVSIDLPNGNAFTVIAQNSSDLNKYIQSAQFNGQDMEIPWFSHEDLLKGGTLKLVMGSKPNKTLWATADSGILYK